MPGIDRVLENLSYSICQPLLAQACLRQCQIKTLHELVGSKGFNEGILIDGIRCFVMVSVGQSIGLFAIDEGVVYVEIGICAP